MNVRATVFTATAALALASHSFATDVTFTGSSGSLAASAKFEAIGNDLVVTLTNTSMNDVLVPMDLLTALFFDVAGPSQALTRTSAVVPMGSTVVFGGTDPGGVVGGEWAYKSALMGAPSGRSYGISSSGFGLFGPGDVFPGTNLQGPADPDGMQYAITSAGDNTGTGNMPVTGANALIKNAVVFTLSGLPQGFDPSMMIRGVVWQYGTDLKEPHFPEPASLALLAVGGAMAIRNRRIGRR